MKSKERKDTFLKKTWTLKFTASNSKQSVVFKIKPIYIIVFLFLLLGVFAVAVKNYNSKLQASELKIQALKTANEQQLVHIDKLRAEKQQMAGLVDKQNLELADKLRDIEQKSTEVRKIVGLKTSKPETEITHRRIIKANRSALVYKNMATQTDSLFQKIGTSEKEVNVIEKKAIAYREEQERKERIRNSIPSIYPCDGYISSEFGLRLHPVYGYMKYHSGIDIASSYGAPIYASASGIVTESGYESGYGYCVKIDHGNGLSTLYGHCSSLIAQSGEYVRKGQLIARIGSTGISTGPHLHYEVLSEGTQINPIRYLN